MNYGDESKGMKKAGYDARQQYAKLLIYIIQNVITYSQSSDYASWENELWHYYSLTSNFIPPKEKENIDQISEDIIQANEKAAGKHLAPQKRENYRNFYRGVLLPPLLRKLQHNIFSATNHLLVPTKEDDSFDEFDKNELIDE